MRRPSLATRVLPLAFVLMLILAGCRRVPMTPAPSPSLTSFPPQATPTFAPILATPSPAEEAPAHGGTLVVGVLAEPDTLNFSLAREPVSYWVLACLDARLVRVRHDNTLEPQILAEVPTVENGGISPDGQRYTLRFRADLTWSDGEPLDARDFFFTWQLLSDPNYPANSRAGWDLIQSIELSSDYLTATVHLKRPSASFLDNTLVGIGERPSGFLLPAHALADLAPQEIAEADYGGVGHISSGPFIIVDWQPGQQLTLERNPRFHTSEVYLDRIVFRFLPDLRELLSQLASGELDLVAGLPEWSLAELHAHPEFLMLVTPRGGAVAMLVVNVQDPAALSQPHPILGDLRVRRALLLGFDRERLVDELLFGAVPVAHGLLDYTPWQARAAPQASPEFDPEQARRLLDDAGWQPGPNGIRMRAGEPLQLTLAVDANPERDLAFKRQIAASFAEDMRALGIDIRITPLTGAARERHYDLLLCWCDRRLTPSGFSAWFSSEAIPGSEELAGENVMGYRSELIDQLLARQEATTDAAARVEILQRLQNQITLEVLVLPIYLHVDIVTGRSHVKGLMPGPMNGIWWNPEQWWISSQEALP